VPDDVVLSDGKECHVETLGYFELDHIPLPNMGVFTYEMEMVTGDKKQVELDLSRYEELPKKPDIPEHELVEGGPAWYRYREWQLVQAALLHGRLRIESTHDYAEQVLSYILNNCVAPEDWKRIKTPEDWEKVRWAALLPQLDRERLGETLRNTFNATFNDEEIFDAMDKTSGGMGAYNALRLWETQLANLLQLRDLEYAMIDLEERSRRICAMKLNDWLEFLDVDRMKRKRAVNPNA
jgi:hypothetical protein